MFACVTLIARVVGPGGQGEFSTLKAAIDFLAALALIGLPQSFLFFLRSQKKTLDACLSIVTVHSVTAGLVVWAWYVLVPSGSVGMSVSGPLVMGVTVALCVIYGDLRGISLATHSAATFARISAVPNVVLLVLVAGWLVYGAGEGSFSGIAGRVVFLGAYAAAVVLVVLIFVPKLGRLTLANTLADIKDLLPFSISSWLPSLFQAAAMLLALKWVGIVVADPDAVGAFGAAATLVATAATPLVLSMPLLFKWWVPLEGKSRLREVRISMSFVLGVAVICCIGLLLFEATLVRFIFGEPYGRYVGLYAVVFVSIVPQAMLRIFSVYCSSCGKPQVSALVECLRSVVIGAALLIVGRDLMSIAFAWVGGELIGLCACLYFMRADLLPMRMAP